MNYPFFSDTKVRRCYSAPPAPESPNSLPAMPKPHPTVNNTALNHEA